MVSINYSLREVCCKIVYYGPGLSGKTTNLQYVHSKVPADTRGKMISLATEADRTLYFDFLPINIGAINGFAAKFQLYTVPGQVYYNATRKLVLRGVDGLVFVADSQPDKMEENIESLTNLEENLLEYGYDFDKLPLVIQYNKRDLPGVLPVEELNARLNTKGWPHFEASATQGRGVFDTLKLIIKHVLERAKGSASAVPRQAADLVAQPAEAPSATPAAVASTTATASVGDSTPAVATAAMAGSSAEAPTARKAATAPAPEPDQAEAIDSTDARVAPAKPGSSPSAGSPEGVQYRPYPGSDQAAVKATEISPAASAAVAEEADSCAAGQHAIEQAGTRPESPPDALSSPAMAPPLRRRDRNRKRGFFKRLFGIK